MWLCSLVHELLRSMPVKLGRIVFVLPGSMISTKGRGVVFIVTFCKERIYYLVTRLSTSHSLTSCLVEHSPGVMPLLIALCITHWFTSLNTLQTRASLIYNILAWRILSFIGICALVSPQMTKRYCS